MYLLPTDEQDEIVATVRSQLEADFDLHALAARDGAASVVDRDLWRRCAELGWFGLGLEESLGGVGYGLVEEALLFAELGSHATPGPFLATVLGARLAAEAGAGEVAASIVGGESVVALAEAEGDRLRVTDHGDADLLLVVGDDGAALVATAGLELRPEPSLDVHVPLATVDAAAARAAAPVARITDAGALLLRGTVLVAAELAGIATATAEQSNQYAKDREQFGVPVGSFQAVKHRCADMAVRAEAATSMVRYAALAVRDGLADAPFHAHAARAVAGDAAVENAQVNVQNHGGIGFTWEHTAHRYVTRAQVLVRTLGDRTGHLGALLEQPAPQ
ncbi:MAG: acyl-CoA dehydrogenase family protein [Microthrixaceae bacterium]